MSTELFVLFLLVMCICLIKSTQDLGLWIYSQIWAVLAEQSQAKPAAWEVLRSIPSHVT
jgi:hypothetical protein